MSFREFCGQVHDELLRLGAKPSDLGGLTHRDLMEEFRHGSSPEATANTLLEGK